MRVILAVSIFAALFVGESLYQRRCVFLAEFVRNLNVFAESLNAVALSMVNVSGLMSGVSASFGDAKKVLADLRADL